MFNNEEMEINMGPQHPSTHGVLRLKLTLDGELVTQCEPIIGYLHRGIEKICENKTFIQSQIWTDRLDYTSAIANNLGWAEAIEKLFGINVPRRARYIRTMLAELNRIASHLVWLATHGLDIGAMTVFLYAFQEREEILDLFESFCGARLTTTAFNIGGLKSDLSTDFIIKLKEFLRKNPNRINEYESLLTENRIWKQRTIGVGILKANDAIAMGVTGPVLRAAGIPYDIRTFSPYAAYSELDFKIPTQQASDTYARYLIRLEEIRQSINIIKQCLDGLPTGSILAKVPKILKAESNEIYQATECPKGELGYYLINEQESNIPYRFHVRAPSFINLQALPMMIKGQFIADVVATIGTLDIVLGEIDR